MACERALLKLTRGVGQFILLALYLILEAFGITSGSGDLGLHLLTRHFRGHSPDVSLQLEGE